MLGAVDRWVAGSASHSSAQAERARVVRRGPERALQIAADVGRGCSGWASGVLGAVDRCSCGLASHSSARTVSRKTKLRRRERASLAAADRRH